MPALDINSRRGAAMLFLILSASVLAAVWGFKWFVTQDGSAHLYNAHILLELRRPDAPLNQFYSVQWTPLPNLAGHLTLMGLMSVMPPRAADRILITLTFLGLACSIGWLRLKVAGWRELTPAVPLMILLALNWMWLMGFYSFSLGACLFTITLGAWWAMRERFGLRETLIIVMLLFTGYFCHIVSFGLTVVGLGILTLATPGSNWARRSIWTVASLIPLIPMGMIYRGLMKSAGESHLLWRNMTSFWSPRQWLMRWQAAETLQLSGRKFLPFTNSQSSWHSLISPTTLAAIGLIILIVATIREARRDNVISESNASFRLYRGWWLLALLLFIVWAIGPDDFGEQHGMYLRPRILLLGLVTLVPLLRFDISRRIARAGSIILAAALVMQIIWVWDYAVVTNRTAGEFMHAQDYAGRDWRVATLLLSGVEGGANPSAPIDDSRRFTVQPLLHLDNLLGIETGNVIWNNYEAGYYMFPVKFREPSATDRALNLDFLNRQSPPATVSAARQRSNWWANLLELNHAEIDELIVWGGAPEIDEVIKQWYGPEPVFSAGRLRIFRLR